MTREQDQFLEVVDRDTAEKRWWVWLRPEVLDVEEVPLASALGRVLGSDVVAGVDVPPFDRSNVHGFAVQAQDTSGAAEETPRLLSVTHEEAATGVVPRVSVEPGTATLIATGGFVPRGAGRHRHGKPARRPPATHRDRLDRR
jgi:putative molybdopterin biosynthesis protein